MTRSSGRARGLRATTAALAVSTAALSLAVWLPRLRPRAAAEDAAPPRVDFSRDIRPLFSDRCFTCHGPDRRNRKARLRFDTREGAFRERGGEVVIIPRKPDESELYRRIVSEDPEERMPPPESGKTLEIEEIARIRRWIAEGAEWKEHWAFVPPKRRPPPEVSNPGWVRNAIDRFVARRLEAEGLEPSPEADRRTLIRRVTFDLTGLPPTLQEVREFVEDASPNAYEKVVDRLLQSPGYGEHMARFWLDAARYGDTHGLHLDNLRVMWPYRDWVIRAFNENMPFDRFTIEQLAGDLLPDHTLSQRVATGFNRCNVTTSEGGAIAEEFYVRYAVDRVETTATVWMGLSAGCAACHDHKFDPITQKEFYQLFAFFNNITEPAMDGNKPVVPPIVHVPLEGVAEALEALGPEIAGAEQRLRSREAALEADFRAWLDADRAPQDVPAEPRAGLLAHYPLDGAGAEIENVADPSRPGTIEGARQFSEGRSGRAYKVGDRPADLGDVGAFEADDAFSYGAWIRTEGKVTGAPIARMDTANGFRGWDLYVQGRRVAMHLIHRWSSQAIKVTTKNDVLEAGEWHHVFVTYDGSRKAAGVSVYVDGVPQPWEVNADSLGPATVRTDVPLYLGQRLSDSPFTGGEIDEVRVYGRKLDASEVKALAGLDPITPLLALRDDERTEDQTAVLRRHFVEEVDEEAVRLRAELEKLRAERRRLEGQTATTLVMEERETPRGAHVLYRGQYDDPREEVLPEVPAALPPMPEGTERNRLGFARWLVDPSHPLTSRVMVNRLWQQKFGTGLVRTSEDFGSQGEPPSHPELLDWLATELLRTGWDVKRMHRLMVTSATYRQSSRVRPDLLRRDPDNRLLARGPRYRLDAEMLRDQALLVSGLLVRRIGGPSVKPPQPPGLWFAVGYTSSNTARFRQDTGEAVYRRSVYTFWKRTAPPPAMATFDAPSRESCIVRRERTNTPLQALLLLNDRQFVEAARRLAARGLREVEGPPSERARYLFELATARPPGPEDLRDLLSAFEDHRARFAADPAAARALIDVGDSKPDASLDPVDLAAWTMVGNLILNLDEVITKS